jgi:hypothetical protein
MAKTKKDKQCYSKHIEERQKIPWPKPTRTWFVLLILAMVLSDILRCVLYNIVCPCAFWPWYCLTFFDVFDNTMAKTNKDNNVMQKTPKNVRQCHGQNQQGQSMLYKTHRRTSDTTMAKTKKHGIV